MGFPGSVVVLMRVNTDSVNSDAAIHTIHVRS